jgi:hypothetical protein
MFAPLGAGSPKERFVYTPSLMRRWTEFLRGSEQSAHAVQIYADAVELAESVAAYVAAGFEAGEPAVLVATHEHERLVRERLAVSGWDDDAIEGTGLLFTVDAADTLAAITDGDTLSATAFERVVGGLLDRVAVNFPERRVRVFGEMVNLLCERGERESAAALEEIWNDALRQRRFSLMCAYRLDVFDRAAQVETLPGVCRAHSHVLPAHDAARLSRAVDLALEEVLGYEEAGRVYFLVADEAHEERVPVAQLALMWVSANMPALADRVLASAKARYLHGPVPSGT